MNLYLADDNAFIEHLSRIIIENLSSENFGVNELIKTAELNRNYLSRRIKSIKHITINQFISEVRLEKSPRISPRRHIHCLRGFIQCRIQQSFLL